MRNKEVIENNIERIETQVKKIGYHIKRNETQEGFNLIEKILEITANIQTLLNREVQD
jgi:hypothetical protein